MRRLGTLIIVVVFVIVVWLLAGCSAMYEVENGPRGPESLKLVPEIPSLPDIGSPFCCGEK